MYKIRFFVVILMVFAFTSVLLIDVASAETCKVDTKTQVNWKKSWYKAKVLKLKPQSAFITYEGYGSSWNEWVGPDRIKCTFVEAAANSYPEGTSVQVKWKNKWWPAKVIGVKKDSWKIHYDGYDNSWDEWVGPDRIKK
ncbi:MAG: Tudor-knot domain-containing protein [Pseudomonadota bacterium]